ncbi:MAG: glycosyltransferase [Clostridia bacterium]|nr:glycosyltransferase [Clostridia bacterium]
MKKILHIVESFGGGVFSFLVDLVGNLSTDYDIVIAYGKRAQTPENFKEYFPENVKFIEIKNFTRSIGIKDIKAFFEIKKIIKEEKPDIVHLHSSKAGFLGKFATNTKRVKVLYNPHGFSFLMQDVSKFKQKIYFLAEKIASLRKATIIGCSEGEYKEALKLTKNSICINNGIDITTLRELTKDLKIKELGFNNLKVCTVGRIGAQKNPSAFNQIAEKLSDIKFTWIGDGDDKHLLVSPNIKITGWLSKKEVLKELNEQDVFILTSLWEGLPISLLEAMYLKKICIVSNCIGNRDVIKNNMNGFVYNDLEELLQIIRNLKNEDLDKIKENEFENIENTFNIDKMVNEYRKIYNES